MSNVTMGLEEVLPLVRSALLRAGADEPNASAVAETVALAERDGASAHGLFRVPGYVASLRSGKVNGRATPALRFLAPGLLRVDGDDGFAPLALRRLREPLADAAREQGVAVAALVRSFHFAALWIEVESLAEEGLVALACCSSKPGVAPAGGTTPSFGTNPLAFAWPRPEREPMVFDQASATMSRGDVQLVARAGGLLPEGVGLDAEGRPTRDPNEVLRGALLPFGGHKGSAIALMVELLAGPLLGEVTAIEAGAADNGDGGPARGGEFVLAIDPSRFGSETEWLRRGEALFAEMLGQEGVRLPGDHRRARRAEIATRGVEVPLSLLQSIRHG